MRSNFTVVAAVAFFVLTPSVADAADDPSAAGGDTSTNVPATTPGEENKGKPVVSPPDTAAQPKAEGNNTSVPTTSPGGENKGKPPVSD